MFFAGLTSDKDICWDGVGRTIFGVTAAVTARVVAD